jgi:FdhD protein
VTVFSDNQSTRAEDRLAVEEPIELRIEDTPIAVLMRTPGDDTALARGFCLTEGILLNPEEFDGLEELHGGRYRVRLSRGVSVDPEQFRRNTYTTSSCGVCGKASIEAVLIASRPLPPGPIVDPDAVYSAAAALGDVQPGFAQTGGLHAAAVMLADGTMLGGAEDIGRHNAVDKAIGAAATRQWPIGESMLVVSGRSSFEITQKAAVAGIPMVAGVSAASSLAVDLARDLGMTLIGFVRDRRMVVYSGEERIATS